MNVLYMFNFGRVQIGANQLTLFLLNQPNNMFTSAVRNSLSKSYGKTNHKSINSLFCSEEYLKPCRKSITEAFCENS